MALQTNVFHNGEWVTRTVLPGDLLKEATAPAPPKPPKRIPTSPTYGILTRTIIESPVFSWVLPVQLRSPKHNDVVFVGVRTEIPLHISLESAVLLASGCSP